MIQTKPIEKCNIVSLNEIKIALKNNSALIQTDINYKNMKFVNVDDVMSACELLKMSLIPDYNNQYYQEWSSLKKENPTNSDLIPKFQYWLINKLFSGIYNNE